MRSKLALLVVAVRLIGLLAVNTSWACPEGVGDDMLAFVLSAEVLDVKQKCMNKTPWVNHCQGGVCQVGDGIIALKVSMWQLVTRACLQRIPEPKV